MCFIVFVILCVVYCFKCVCVCYFVFLCIVVPLPPGINPFAVNNSNNNTVSATVCQINWEFLKEAPRST